MTVFTARVATILLGLAISGCAANSPPSWPTAAAISAQGVSLNAAATTGLSPADYAQVGFTQVRQNCSVWFTKQVQNSQGFNFGMKLLALLGGAGAIVGGPAALPLAAGAGLAGAAVGSYESAFGAGSNPSAIYGLIGRVQDEAIAAMPTPQSYAEADALVSSLWEKCSLPYIANAVMAAMNTVPLSASSPMTSASLIGGERVRFAPPKITIGAAPAPVYASSQSSPTLSPPGQLTPSYGHRSSFYPGSPGQQREYVLRRHTVRAQPIQRNDRPAQFDEIGKTGRNAYEGGPRELPPPVPRNPTSIPLHDPEILPAPPPIVEPEPSARAAIPIKPAEQEPKPRWKL